LLSSSSPPAPLSQLVSLSLFFFQSFTFMCVT
jgi:hypothetical protein